MRIPIESIVKYILFTYHPYDIKVEKVLVDGEPEILLDLYFKKISDSYLLNPMARDTIGNKEAALETKIRLDIENFFSVKTSGLTISNKMPFGISPYLRHGLRINVRADRSKE